MTVNHVDYVKFNGFTTQSKLERVQKVLANFSEDKQYNNINDVIELYNIDELIKSELQHDSCITEQIPEYDQKSRFVNRSIAKFFSTIDDKKFIDTIKSVHLCYIEDFFVLFQRYHAFDHVSPEIFIKCLQHKTVRLEDILVCREVVNHYDEALAVFMRQSEQSAAILATKFLKKDGKAYYIPSSLSPKEFESIFLSHINSLESDFAVLKLIIESQSSKECPISDKLRYLAKKAFNEKFNALEESSLIRCEVSVSFKKQNEPITRTLDGLNLSCSYNIDWFKENLDNPTILNNFIYVFEMFDSFCRSTLVSQSSQIGVMWSDFTVESNKSYHKGVDFDVKNNLACVQMLHYVNFLKDNNIRLEEVFKWFFESYLPEEFNVQGFSMIVTSQSVSLVEKIRNMAIEMEASLKRFKLFVQEGEIDQGLYEEKRDHLSFGDVPSLIQNKYIYPRSKRVQQAMFILCSEQSPLSYTARTGSQYKTLYKMLIKEEVVKLSDFEKSKTLYIQSLIEIGVISINQDEVIKLNKNKAYLLFDLYLHEVACPYYSPFLKATIDEMVASEDLIVESKLFSRPERDYLNYMLNKAEFSDGLDLRNKYVHGIYPKDDKHQESDYVRLLILMTLVITKINDEFCMRDLLSKIEQPNKVKD